MPEVVDWAQATGTLVGVSPNSMEEQKRPFHICPQVVDYATEFFRVPEELRTKGIVVVSGKKAGQFPGHT